MFCKFKPLFSFILRIDDVLIVSRDYELYLMGLELDFTYDDFEQMFKFNNPKATSSCGCGTSFSI